MSFFRENVSNEKSFVQLDELDEWDRINDVWIGFDYCITQARKTYGCND